MMRRNTRVSFNFTIIQLYTPEKSFIEQYGLVRYSQYAARTYREWTRETGLCEMCGGYDRRFRVIVDHCHAHGWIRGFSCNSCNALLGKYERGLWTNYDTLFCPHAHWRYQHKSGKPSQQAITNYEICLRNIRQNVRLHEAWTAQIGKCPDCCPQLRLHRLPELLDSIPLGVTQGRHAKGQISAEYLRQRSVKARNTSPT